MHKTIYSKIILQAVGFSYTKQETGEPLQVTKNADKMLQILIAVLEVFGLNLKPKFTAFLSSLKWDC